MKVREINQRFVQIRMMSRIIIWDIYKELARRRLMLKDILLLLT